MKIHQGIFFQSSKGGKMVAEAIVPPGYHWNRIDEPIIMQDPIFIAKDRRIKARVRLADGHLCYGFFDQTSAVAYYMWITIAHDAAEFAPWELNTRLILKPKTKYIWDCFTADTHRQRGLYRAGLLMARDIGIKDTLYTSYICCMKDNIASQKGIQSAGFHDIFKFTVGRIGPLVFCKRESGGFSVGVGAPRFNILG